MMEYEDIVERLRDRADYYEKGHLNTIEWEAATEIERLREALRYEENRSNRIGTHGDGCYSWGPSHYECAMREIERLREEVCDLKDLMQSTVNYTGISVSTEKYAFHASKALGEKE